MDVTPILNKLNSAQEEAVTSDKKHLLVLAGAGSGKTRVLVHRIAWKIQVDGVSPYSILAVTFTNKASREMRERIDQLLGMSLRGMWVGTFHGLAHRLLKAHWRDVNLPENFQILDSDDQLRLVKRVMRAMEGLAVVDGARVGEAETHSQLDYAVFVARVEAAKALRSVVTQPVVK